jgi:hypothetical protein
MDSSPLAAAAFKQIAADVAKGLVRCEITMHAFDLGGHFGDGPQHVAAQGVSDDLDAGALGLLRAISSAISSDRDWEEKYQPMRGLLEKLSRRPPRGEEPPAGDGMPQVREGTYALSLVPVVIVAITTGRAVAELDPVRAVAVLRIPVLGFLPFGRCCVVPFLGAISRA